MPIVIDVPPTNPFTEATDLIGRLPNLCQTVREERGLTVKQAAAQIGISADTLANFEANSNATKATILAILVWMGK